MRLVIQRVKMSSVTVEDRIVGSIEKGMLILVGFGKGDTPDLPGREVWKKILDKIVHLRIFPDSQGKTNKSLTDAEGGILAIPQFTLYADMRKGRRPGFDNAADPGVARDLYERFVSDLTDRYGQVETGMFGADMDVRLVNWGPVTLVLDSADLS